MELSSDHNRYRIVTTVMRWWPSFHTSLGLSVNFPLRLPMSCAYFVKAIHISQWHCANSDKKHLSMHEVFFVSLIFSLTFFCIISFFLIQRLLLGYGWKVYVSVRWPSRLNWHFDMTAREWNWILCGWRDLTLESYFGQKLFMLATYIYIEGKMNEMKTGKTERNWCGKNGNILGGYLHNFLCCFCV